MKPENNRTTFIAWRFYFIIIFILLITAGLMYRAVDLAVIKRHFLQVEGDARSIRTVTVPAFRGMISDRNGFPLAISTSVYSVWVNPEEFIASPAFFNSLSGLLDIPVKKVATLIQQAANKKREFVYLKRAISPELAEQIKRLKVPGLYLQQEYKRFYPEGEVAAHVVGFTNVDDHGVEGMELGYDSWLAGVSGKKVVLKDRLGRIVSNKQIMQEEKSGKDLTLSIDKRIQYLAYRELMTGIKNNIASSGSVVVIDTTTGEVLAMVNQPSFNPNNRGHAKKEDFRNRAVTDIFEPGSTIKAFSIASALDSGQFKPDTVIDTFPGWIRVGHNVVQDEHNLGKITLAEVLQHSSNVGATKIILALPPNQLWSVLHRVGFGELTGIEFPGERSGVLIHREKWAPFTLATLTFGYGVSVTTLQLAEAYSIFANQGIKIPVTLLKRDTVPSGKRVMEAAIANQMLILLQSVVDAKGATGNEAKVPGYHIAGKTGTARMATVGGYKKQYIASFVGIAPVTRPRILVAVVIDNPRGKHYFGGEVSGPVFEKIMEGTLRILNIPPDNIESLQQKKS